MRPPRARPRYDLSQFHSWPRLWQRVKAELRRAGYGESTLRLYRQALRALRDSGVVSPAGVNASAIKRHLYRLTDGHIGWSWTAAQISVFRTVFDKMGGKTFTVGLRTPKRPEEIPFILRQHEIMEILTAAKSIRDQLMLGLLYGCGLKVGELCALRWEDVNMKAVRPVDLPRTASLAGLNLPFRAEAETLAERVRAFYRTIKNRFLAHLPDWQRATGPPG